MKQIVVKFVVASLAVIIAYGAWTIMVELLMKSGIPLLKTLAVFFSHFSLLGYLFFGLLSVLLYTFLMKVWNSPTE